MRSVPGLGWRNTSARRAISFSRRSATMSFCPRSLCARFTRVARTGWLSAVLLPTMRTRSGLLDVVDRSGIASITNGAPQADSRGSLAVPRAIIHVICADNCTGQLLHQVAFFVGALRRRNEGERIGPACGFDLRESARDEGERFVPGGFAELSVFANQRTGEAVFAVRKSPAEFPLTHVETPFAGPSAGSTFKI